MRVEREGGTPIWVVGSLEAPSVQPHGLLQPWELWPYQSLFLPLIAGNKKASLAKSFFIALSIQALRGLPYLGSSAVPCASGTKRGPPSWGPTL